MSIVKEKFCIDKVRPKVIYFSKKEWDMLNLEKIGAELLRLGAKPPKIIYYELTDSTNTRAREYARQHPDNRESVIFIAEGQSARHRRRFMSCVANSGCGRSRTSRQELCIQLGRGNIYERPYLPR